MIAMRSNCAGKHAIPPQSYLIAEPCLLASERGSSYSAKSIHPFAHERPDMGWGASAPGQRVRGVDVIGYHSNRRSRVRLDDALSLENKCGTALGGLLPLVGRSIDCII